MSSQSEYNKKRVRQLKASGFCIVCGFRHPEPGRVSCEACLEKNRKISIEYHRTRRALVIEQYGGECVCCGESEPEFLTFDHINDDGAQHRKIVKPGSGFVGYVLREMPDDVQLLCYNCNCAKGHYGICPHERTRKNLPKTARKVGRIRKTQTINSMLEMQPVASSQIAAVGYDPATQTLQLKFVHGGSVYQYQPFSPDAYQALMSAPSIGSHFLKQIKPRPDLYPFRKVEAANPGRAPFTKRKKLERSK